MSVGGNLYGEVGGVDVPELSPGRSSVHIVVLEVRWLILFC